jgi:hypothetical protein
MPGSGRISRGVIATLEAAAEAGWIDTGELERQRYLLARANEVEHLRGAAIREYIEPSRGDLKHVAAGRLLELARVYSRRHPLNIELWLVGTGSSDVAGMGLRRFLRDNRRLLKGAYFIILDQVGAGVPVIYRREGKRPLAGEPQAGHHAPE